MRKLFFLLIISVMLLFLAACQQQAVPLPTQAAIAEIDQTVEAAVAATMQANAGGGESSEALPPVTWTPIPVVNEDTPEPDSTEPAPPTITAVPTETPFIPTHTPEPTNTPVPPATDTPVPQPVQPQPTSPPPEPTIPPQPIYGGNILVNASFEDGWYHQNGIPELQLPNGWTFEYDEGPTGYGNEPWDKWVRPETRVLPDYQLPENERSLFVREGQYTIKMFKGSGAISFRLYQDIALQPGTYTFQVNIYPDLVVGYSKGNKVLAGDPTSGEIRFISPDGGTGWILPAFGTWNVLEHTFSIADAQTIRIGVGIRGRYALNNNGWFFDNWSLKQIEN